MWIDFSLSTPSSASTIVCIKTTPATTTITSSARWARPCFFPSRSTTISGSRCVRGLQPLLAKYGNDHRLTFIVFTLDESSYSRELAPLAGHDPALRLGPPWRFHDSPGGMMRFRQQATETLASTTLSDSTTTRTRSCRSPRATTQPRRVDSTFLAGPVAEHRLDESEAFELIEDLTVNLVREAYKL